MQNPREHSAIHLTFIKLPFVIKIFVLSNFEWPYYTGFTVAKMLVQRKFYLSLRKVNSQRTRHLLCFVNSLKIV